MYAHPTPCRAWGRTICVGVCAAINLDGAVRSEIARAQIAFGIPRLARWGVLPPVAARG